ncbi:PAAR-like protein [Paenibacillus thiaminolyticus]|uniref:PAAR-like protein n=1 Tax=Paenibacillus thiaminolyticus TaxID=49283 RepID=UPI003D2C3CB9
MAKEYVVETALISCQYGTAPVELQVPDHRHIYADDKKLSNITDIDASCIGCFGTCTSPYLFGYNSAVMNQLEIQNIQQARPFIADNGCIAEVAIPWQNPQPDVFAGHYHAMAEGCWTVCQKGFGIISVVGSGQSPATNEQTIMNNLKQLEQAVEAYMQQNNIKPKHKEKLMESILLWDDYEQIFWERESDEHTNGFAEYLKKDDPALFNFFERKITMQDKATGKEVDLTYFMGLMKGFGKDRKDSLESISPELLGNDSMLHAYLDAANIDKGCLGDIEDMSLTEMVDRYYGLSNEAESRSKSRYADYVNQVAPSLDRPVYYNTVPGYEQASEEEKKFIILQGMIGGRLQYGNSEEYASGLTDRFLDKLRGGLEEERWR